MSSLVKFVRRLVARLSLSPQITPDLRHLTLRDWADLPPYHPHSDVSSF